MCSLDSPLKSVGLRSRVFRNILYITNAIPYQDFIE
jgi:hypothetical protein